MATRISKMATNFNNKLDCPKFIHLDLAPEKGLPESVLQNTVYEIITEDNSHSPIKVKLDDLARLELGKVSNLITWQSHGMTLIEFIDYMIGRGKDITKDTPMAVYLFHRVTNVA